MYMMPGPQPMAVQVMPPPPPVQVGVPMPFPVAVPVVVTKKTTTTTEAPSPEEKEENNMMFINGNPFAPPVIVMPVPQSNVRRVEYKDSIESDSTTDDSSSDSSDSSNTLFRARKKHKQRRIRIKVPQKKHRLRVGGHGQKHHENHHKQERNKRHLKLRDPGFIKPVLTYQSKHGDIKFKKKINGDDAARLMGMKNMHTIEEESSDTSQDQAPMKNSGLRIVEDTEKTKGLGTLPDNRVSNITVSYRLY